MKTLDQILSAAAQGSTPTIRATTLLTNLEKNNHTARLAGPAEAERWEQESTTGIPQMASTIALGHAATGAVGAGKG
jgi:hypothetical protein